VKEVELSEEADAQVDEIDAWWRQNRRRAPHLFRDELEKALADLEAMPSLGTHYRAGSEPMRRVLLRRTHYHLYFIEEPERIYVVAVWSCFRGHGPRL
jgi:plasmid stabilization system protein ParE